ncbi:MAG: MFS transporter, partial [Myxococcaceae bacterium]
GYFVDIYDLVLFGVVRIESLKAIQIPTEQLLDAGMLLINCQMAGMLIGGFFWGALADRKGRTTVMMASILLYSLANFANAFVFSLNTYAILRFIAGFGLSGEVGAAVTLISESSLKHRRTLWTTLLTAFGLMGAVAAGLIGDALHWQVAYLVGGGMGLLLLCLRLYVSESSLFLTSPAENRGRIDLFVRSRKRFLRYLACILVGVPIWYVVGILMTFSPELMKVEGMQETVSAGKAILFCYIGLCMGDLVSGLLSHIFASRRGVIGCFMLLSTCMITVYLNSFNPGLTNFYMLCSVIGFSAGYWAVYVTMLAESFGTNIRGTAVITVTNWMRGSVVLMTLGIQWFQKYMTLAQSAFAMAAIVLILATISLLYLTETFGKDLDYREL